MIVEAIARAFDPTFAGKYFVAQLYTCELERGLNQLSAQWDLVTLQAPADPTQNAFAAWTVVCVRRVRYELDVRRE